MSKLILATKLYIPPPGPKVVLRPRLIDRLNEGLLHKLILISAPAGFGKTTLVREWVASCERPAAWLSLDEGDNDPTRFLVYLVAALQTIVPNIGKGVLGVLQSPQPPPAESILTGLLNEITTVMENFTLVLDDYHVIDAKPVDMALAFLIKHLPPQMHLVIATREDPQLPLARLRARGQLTEFRATNLCFTLSEAAGFLNQVMGLDLSEEDIAALENRTEGWITGLQLAAISMQGHKDATSFIKSFTGKHHFVLDYLLEEVLYKQSESVQTFLLSTSILDRLCGPLCDAVLLDPAASGQETLGYLEQANLFLVPLDNERRWYRYHHLFTDLLRQRLRQREDKDINELHIRASVWYEDNGLDIEAFHHATAAKDFERAAGLLELIYPEMDGSFQSATWLCWVKTLPDEVVRVRPVLSAGYAQALVDTGELEAAEPRLRDVERMLDTMADMNERPEVTSTKMVIVYKEQLRSLPITIATARSSYAQALGDTSNTLKYARQALDLIPEGDHLKRGQIGGLLGLSYWSSGDLEEAYQNFTNCMVSFKMAGNILFAITTKVGLAGIRVAQGRLQEAITEYEQSLQIAAEQDEPVQMIKAEMYLGLSAIHCEQDHIEAAIQHLLTSKEQGEQTALLDWQYRWCLAQARIKEIQGDLDATLKQLHEAERLHFRNPRPNTHPIAALKTRVWIKQGKLTEVLAWAHERGLSVNDDLSYMREFEHITLTRVLLARYKSDHANSSILEAIGLLERLLKAAESGKRIGSVIEILVLQTLIHEAQGNIPLALAPLKRALALAEPEGYVRVFVDEGIPMAQLLSEAAVKRIIPDYTAKLLEAFEAEEQKRKGKSSLPPAQPLIEPLSRRELEVLQLIAQGLSNREISERLFLALSTVKGHNRNIFGKLQVQRRTEAVARARELGLL